MTNRVSSPVLDRAIGGASPAPAQSLLVAALIWNAVIALASLAFSINTFADPLSLPAQLQSLGDPVRIAIGLIGGLPALLAIVSGVRVALLINDPTAAARQPGTRVMLLSLYLLTAIGGGLVLIHLWRIFYGFEPFVTGVMNNSALVLGLPLAYAVFWIGGRMADDSRARRVLEQAALAILLLTIIALMLLAGMIDGVISILSTYAQIEVWIATAVLIISSVLGWRLLHYGTAFGETTDDRTAWQGWLMLMPNIVGFSLFFAGPLLLSLYLSFTNSTAGAIPQFTGIDNYVRMMSLEFVTQPDLTQPAQTALSFGYRELASFTWGAGRVVIGALDPIFWQSLRNTIVYCLLLLPLAIAPAIGLALILNTSLPGVKFYRAIYFLPSVAAVVGTALIWRWLYDPVIGFFNYFISQVVGFLNGLGIPAVDPAIRWLSDPNIVLLAVVFLGAWQVVGYNTVLFLAGLQGIPQEMYEASAIDGADGVRRFWYITLPLLRPTTFFVTITTIVTGLQVFNEPYALFPSRPLPLQATTSVFYLYTKGFNEFQFGYASAVAWVLFVLIFTVTLVQFRLQNRNPYD